MECTHIGTCRNSKIQACRTESILHSSHALQCVAAYFFAKGANANEIDLCEASHKSVYVESYIMRRNRLKHLTFL